MNAEEKNQEDDNRRIEIKQEHTNPILPFPSLGANEGTTNSRYLMLVKRAFAERARKGGSSVKDIFRYVRPRCTGAQSCIYEGVQKGLRRLLRGGYIYPHDVTKQRFKLTSKGKTMLYKQRRQNVCNYRPQKKKNVCRYPQKRRKSKQMCRYRPQKKKNQKKQVNRYRSQKKRKNNQCRYRSRKSKKQTQSKRKRLVCQYI